MFFTETNIRKLDYTLKTAEERKAFVDNLMQELPKSQLNNKAYIEVLLLKETSPNIWKSLVRPARRVHEGTIIVSAMTPEEKKSKMILTDNRMVTVNKRETSYQNLVSKFENGEDGL